MRGRWPFPGRALLLVLLMGPTLAQEEGGCGTADEAGRLRCQLGEAMTWVKRQRELIEESIAELERKEALIKDIGAQLFLKEAVVKAEDPGVRPRRRRSTYVMEQGLPPQDRRGRQLEATDLPTIIAELPTNTTSISLPGNGLTGTLPADLGRLTHLEYLDLSWNAITGTVPAELGTLTQLTVLNLAGNQLTGTVPTELGNLSQLTELDLFINQLTGTIPPELGKLTRLTHLDVNHNGLNGTLPADLGRLVNLQYLDLSFNDITGTLPAELGNLVQLTDLGLQNNQLTGTLPVELGNLSQLVSLTLQINQLRGTVPAELGGLTQLGTLLLYSNRLTGTVPAELGNLANVRSLYLSNNQLHGTVPASLGKMEQIIALSFGSNQLAGTVPPDLGKLAQLGTLDLSSNRLTGTIPPELGNPTQLTGLVLGRNQLTGTVPPELGKLVKLTTLDLSWNALTGTLPDELGSLLVLENLTLAGNRFSGTLPEAIGQLQALLVLDVSDNLNLTGHFPDTRDTKLITILASSCSFTSAGAVGFGTKTLKFANNNLTDFPPAWVYLLAVLDLDVSNNHITSWRLYGVLPAWAFQPATAACGISALDERLYWPSIQSVNVSGNPFGLSITTRDFLWSFAYLTSLSELFAAKCQLQGEVPLDISGSLAVVMEDTGLSACAYFPHMPAGFQGLLTLDLSDNNISAIMPPPPRRLSMVDLHSNPLSELGTAWYSTPNSLEVWNAPLLRAAVAPPSHEGGCASGGAAALEADPFGFVTKPGDDAFQCTTLCAGMKTRYKHDASLNVSSLCRCTAGRQGAATNCTGCPADTYSDAEDEWAMVRTCRPCPERSSTDFVQNATSIDQCKCQAGWYMEMLPAGPGNATTARPAACRRCSQGRFMDTLPGATEEAQCICNASYDGLRALLGRCGCSDGLYMDNVALACRPCDAAAEECTWGSNIELSLLPPVIKPSYWAAPPTEASNFSKHDIWRCFNKDTCPGHGACASGRSGTACSLCTRGMYGGPAGPCQPCPYSPEDSRKALLYGLLVGPAATIAAHAMLHMKADSRGLALSSLTSLRTSAKQSLKYLQMLGVMAGFNIDWPPLALQFLTEVSQITVALPQVAGVACLTGQQTASLEMGFRWLMPVAGLLSACLSALLLAPLRLFGRKSRYSEFAHMSYWDVLRVSFWGLALFYSTLLQFGTQVLACAPGPNGMTTVVTFPHLQCGDSGEWALLAAMSFAFLFVFVGAVFLGTHAAWRRATRALVESNFQSSGWWGFLFDDYRGGWGHWLMLTMAKDAALVAVATAGASDGPSQLLATVAISTVYSYAVLRDQPFENPSNNVLEAWTMMSVAALSVLTAGMGFQSTPGVVDVTALYRDGAADPEYQKRERTLLAVQCFTFVGPTGIMLYQLLCASEKVRKRLPAFLLPPTDEERAKWNRDFFKSLRIDEAMAPDLWGVLERFDVVDTAKFRDLMNSSTATLGVIPSSARGINIKRMVRKRFVEVAKASGNNEAPAAETLNASPTVPAEDAKEEATTATLAESNTIVSLGVVFEERTVCPEGTKQVHASHESNSNNAMLRAASSHVGQVAVL